MACEHTEWDGGRERSKLEVLGSSKLSSGQKTYTTSPNDHLNEVIKIVPRAIPLSDSQTW